MPPRDRTRRKRRHGGGAGRDAQLRGAFLTRTARVLRTTQAKAAAMASGPRRHVARINRLARRDPDEIAAALRAHDAVALDWCPDAFLLPPQAIEAVAASDLYAEGAVYVQNPSSLVPVLALDARPGERILDVCAAPGGKASHLASVTGNGARLWLNDSDRRRATRLREVMAWQGASYESLTLHPGQYIDRHLEPGFDRILLDAQCSGEGRIALDRRRALEHWSLSRIKHYGRLQQRMLVAAFRLLAPGGTLVYATCTFAPEENEAPVDYLLRHFDARLEAVDLPSVPRAPAVPSWEGTRFTADLGHALRVLPTDPFEAFFVCRIVRGCADVGAA